MMFLVLFGSLAAAMAVVAQGNLRTADSSLKVSRAMSAAETGLAFASARMASESRRFIVEKGVIDSTFADELWSGTIDPSEVTVLPPVGYPPPGSDPPGIMQAIRDAHLADSHDIIVEAGDADLPTVDTENGILLVRPIALDASANSPYFRLRYEFLGEETSLVRLTSTGVDDNVSRTLAMDFRIEKKIEYSILSTNRIMIGKNVVVHGPLGSRYGVDPVTGDANPNELETDNGDPLVMRSDFNYLDDTLDLRLQELYLAITNPLNGDVDGDGRLRPDHPVEAAALAPYPQLTDYDGDEYVDDFDQFLSRYDTNPVDFKVVYDAALSGGMTVEFEEDGEIIDFQLARLIDESRPDRDGDGEEGSASDRALGWQDGIIDAQDLYAKVTGRLAFAVARADWETAQAEPYQNVVQGPIRPGIDQPAVTFEVSDEELLEISTDMFNDSHNWFEAQVPAETPIPPGDPPLDPADLAVGAQVLHAGTFTPASSGDWESVPFGSAGAYDYYQRPLYQDFVFKNVRIPRGNNGLFQNCTFVGVVFVEAEGACDHKDWNYAGAVEPIDDGMGGFTYELRFPDLPPPPPDHIDVDGVEVRDTRDYSNNIRFDGCTFLGSVAADKLDEYTHWRNKVQITGATRSYLYPEEVVPDTLTDSSGTFLLKDLLTDHISDAAREELAKSSILMPGWSVDVGNFTNEQDPDPALTPWVRLKGVIIAGVLDVRGTAEIKGTLLMTFRPKVGEGPLSYGGQPDAFNTTIGYFGPTDGDDEGSDPGGPGFNGFGEIRLIYDPDAQLPDGIPWPVRMVPEPDSYFEGGS